MIGELAREFEDVVEAIFIRQGFNVRRNTVIGRNEVDIVISNEYGSHALVDVKLYRSRKISTRLILNAVMHLDEIRQINSRFKGIIVMTADISPEIRHAISNDHPNITIYDLSILRSLVASHADLVLRLEDIIRKSTPASSRLEAEADTAVVSDTSLGFIEEAVPEPIRREPKPQIGAQIIEAIGLIKAGKKEARQYEIELSRAIRYIFDQDLVAFSDQRTTFDGLSRYDLVARVASNHDFWNMISGAFKSHYVIFEFKNYTDRIQQGQIYTTEKYLYSAALRTTAFIISHHGPNRNAAIAARGALRETGKLMVNLKTSDIISMLTRKDAGEDPSALLVDIVDEMLTKLGR